MQKRKLNLLLVVLSILGLVGIVISNRVLTDFSPTKASSFNTCSLTCANGKLLVCKGDTCSVDRSDPNDPTCTADGKTKHCSDTENTDKEKKKNKKNNEE